MENLVLPANTTPWSASGLNHLLHHRFSSLAHNQGKGQWSTGKYHAERDENSEFVRAEYVQIEEMLEAYQKITRVNRKEVFFTPKADYHYNIPRPVLTVEWLRVAFVSHVIRCHLFDYSSIVLIATSFLRSCTALVFTIIKPSTWPEILGSCSMVHLSCRSRLDIACI